MNISTNLSVNQKGNSLIIVLLGILVLTLIGGAYYFGTQKSQLVTPTTKSQTLTQNIPSPTPDPAADWKTYTNTAVGFSIKYPARYSTPTFNDPNTDFSLVNGKEDNTVIWFGSSQGDNVSLQVFPYAGKLEDIEIFKPVPFIDGLHISSPSEVNVSGQKGIVYLARPTDNSSSTLKIYFTGNKHGFILEANLGHSDQEIKDILSTFKFTDQTSSTSDWKTYTNNTYGIDFKYPKSFTLSNTSIDGQMIGIVVVSIPQDYYPNTNFSGATLGFSIDKGANASDCKLYKSEAENIKFTSTKNINGVIFDAANTTLGAAGTSHYDYVYHYFKNDLCYEINSDVAIGNINNYDPSIRPEEIKDSEVESLLGQILATFKFN